MPFFSWDDQGRIHCGIASCSLELVPFTLLFHSILILGNDDFGTVQGLSEEKGIFEHPSMKRKGEIPGVLIDSFLLKKNCFIIIIF